MRSPGLIFAALALPSATMAQTPPDAATLKAIETIVPAQSWYPEGYYDVRIAAEADEKERKRPADERIFDFDDGLGKRFDVVDCSAEGHDPAELDPASARYGFVASEVARLRADFIRLKLPAAAWIEPLLAFERAEITQAAQASETEIYGIETAEASEAAATDEIDDSGKPDSYALLAAAVEANRVRLAPKAPKIVVEGGCGAGEGGPVIVRTSPPGGEVLLVNAFAFKVCTRKQPDPWDRFKCKWNEVETGVERQLAGRYVYQIRWPDGVVRKGTREIVPNYDEESAVTVTFKKSGS